MQIKNKLLLTTFLCLFSSYIIGLNFNPNIFYNNLLFWIPVIGMLTILFYQIFYFKGKEYLILTEIFLFYLCLHLIYQIGFYGLGSTDSYLDYAFFKTILATSHFSLGGEISGWPILHILASELFIFTNSGSSIQIAKFLPSFISSIIILPIYVLANSLYKNKKVSLLTCLIFGTIPQFVQFEGYFVREILGVFFMVLLFYIVYSYKKNPQNRSFLILFFLIFPTLILSHHFSSFLFMIILIIFLVMNQIVEFIYKPENNGLKSIALNTVLMLFTVSLFAYWIYNTTLIWENMGLFFKGLLGITEVTNYLQQAGLTGSIISLRGNILYYGFFVFNTILGAILILKLIIDNNKEKTEELTFIFFLIFCGFYGILATFFISSSIFPQRLLTFGWIFGVIPLAGFLLTIDRMNNENLKIFRTSLKKLTKPKIMKHSVIKVLFIMLIFSFMTFNLYNIDPNYIEKNYSVIGIADYKEYTIANTIKFESSYTSSNSSERYYGYSGAINAIFDEQNIKLRTVGKDLSRIKYYEENFTETDKIAIINENIILQYLDYQKLKSIQDYNNNMIILSYKNSSNIDKIADLGNNVYILKGTVSN